MSISFIYPNLLWLFLLLPLTAALALAGRKRPTVGRFWFGLGLRLLLLALLILALAGLQIRRRADTLTAVFVLDVSDSVPAEERARGEAIVRQAVGDMPTGDRAAVVVFGQDALVERVASESPALPRFSSVPVTVRTDIAGALQLAMALFPDEGAKRLVLLSDGRENLRYALSQAELAAANQIELSYVPLGLLEETAVEVAVAGLDAPADARQGQRFDLAVAVHSTAQVGATLRLFADGQLIHSQEVRLQTGTNRFLVPVEAEETGFHRYRAQVVPDADSRLQNNEASAFTVILGPPRVLLVEGRPGGPGEPGEGENLARALRSAGMTVVVAPPSAFPTSLPELSAYETIILVNVPAAALPSQAMELLQIAVRDLSKGLLVSGGEDAFGAGGYLRTPLEETLPVDMDVRNKEQSPNLALAMVIDKSGSMGRCHCDNPSALPGEYDPIQSGQPKVDIAKEAIMRAAAALGPQDYLGVVAFDEMAHWAVQVSPLIDVVALERSIGGFAAIGQTNVRSGVEAAYAALQEVEARTKHVILLTDGWVREGELTGLAAEMRENGITLSVVAAGQGAALYLQALSETGGGRFYPAVDILRVPDFFLKETVQAVGEYIIEEPFYPLPAMPGPALQGLDVAALPPLLGYNGTTLKSTARILLGTPRDDPLLATWQYGLGRAAAWTSDLKGQWASEWLTWDGFARFAAQVVAWTLPAPQVEGIEARAHLEDDQAVIAVEASDEDGRPRDFLDIVATVIGPDLKTTEVALPQVGAGQYEARLALDAPGTYLVRVGVSQGEEVLGQQTLGLVVPYSPEYAPAAQAASGADAGDGGVDRALLEALARLTGGGKLPDPAAAFAHNLPAADRAREVWQPLLLLAALLFPLDVAIRRVMLGRSDVRKALAWVRERLFWRRRVQAGQERLLGALFRARERGRGRTRRQDTRREEAGSPTATATPPTSGERSAGQAPAPTAPASQPMPQPMPRPTPAAQTPDEVGEDALARLRTAKRRARDRAHKE
ncbi:MAG: VWA domain-containing protein [Anaerolineae bacterium]|nr:VWA domain-containing protein [Anaerolineae bacterium]